MEILKHPLTAPLLEFVQVFLFVLYVPLFSQNLLFMGIDGATLGDPTVSSTDMRPFGIYWWFYASDSLFPLQLWIALKISLGTPLFRSNRFLRGMLFFGAFFAIMALVRVLWTELLNYNCNRHDLCVNHPSVFLAGRILRLFLFVLSSFHFYLASFHGRNKKKT